MAVFTSVSEADAARICAAHGLGALAALEPIPAGSVNTNYYVDTAAGRRFLRVYEEQGPEGVAYESELLAHLGARGLQVPVRVAGPTSEIGGKPAALFELVGGVESCQLGVTPVRAAAVGAWLARAHLALDAFAVRRAGRFELGDVVQRLGTIDLAARPELAGAVARLREVVAAVEVSWPTSAPHGVIHGDLFRDNVRWTEDRIVAVIDWESASDGLRVYDLLVTVLAWCFDDAMRWDLARALVRSYDEARPLTPLERASLRTAGLAAAARFATTRITDYEIRPAIGARVHKDYRRFLARLEAIAAETATGLEERLL